MPYTHLCPTQVRRNIGFVRPCHCLEGGGGGGDGGSGNAMLTVVVIRGGMPYAEGCCREWW